MKIGWQRRLAVVVGQFLQWALSPWGEAIARELPEIEDDTEALFFALDGLRGLAPRLLPELLRRGSRDARAVGVACAVSAVCLGLAYMAMAGAPPRYLATNAAALLLGLAGLAALSLTVAQLQRWPGLLTLAMAGALLATGLWGDRVEGAARWVSLGALFIQPSLVLLPVLILGFARARDSASAAGVVVAALALALQPDRAMAGVLASSVTVLAILRPERATLAAAGASLFGLAVTLVRADTLPAMPYVDQILSSSFAVGPLAGVAVVGGSALLVLPAMLGRWTGAARADASVVFATIWTVMILSAALGNYPTPVVGYSGGAVVGYVLSLTLLPVTAGSAAKRQREALDAAGTGRPDQPQRVGWALSQRSSAT